ncbi:hypothetical protein [uncultured Arcobacter sp.]|uniref:hypothetical protein n=1 Tax=uncultured Arcobacter sp. TaxID=165434 RepID=UPI00262FD80E|nr:hypothetical protein [uncultured Arcobacter sp.]
MDNFIPDIKQAIDKSDKQGVYAYIKKDKNYKYLAKYNPRQNEMFVLTVLSPTMDRLDVDYKVVIECFEEFFNFELAENDYYIIRDSENDMEYFMESIDGNKTLTIIDDENNSLSIPVIEI